MPFHLHCVRFVVGRCSFPALHFSIDGRLWSDFLSFQHPLFLPNLSKMADECSFWLRAISSRELQLQQQKQKNAIENAEK